MLKRVVEKQQGSGLVREANNGNRGQRKAEQPREEVGCGLIRQEDIGNRKAEQPREEVGCGLIRQEDIGNRKAEQPREEVGCGLIRQEDIGNRKAEQPREEVGCGLIRQEDIGNRKAEQPREEVDRKEEPAEMPMRFQRKWWTCFIRPWSTMDKYKLKMSWDMRQPNIQTEKWLYGLFVCMWINFCMCFWHHVSCVPTGRAAFYRDYWRSVWLPHVLHAQDDAASLRQSAALGGPVEESSLLLQGG